MTDRRLGPVTYVNVIAVCCVKIEKNWGGNCEKLKNLGKSGKSVKFRKIVEKLGNSGKIGKIWKIREIVRNLEKFQKISEKILKFRKFKNRG